MSSTVIDMEPYFHETCQEICGYHKLFNRLYFPQGDGEEWKWGFLFEKKCSVDCPLERLHQLLKEERDQNMKLQLEYGLEVL